MRIVDVCAFYAPEGGGVKTYVERKLRAAERMGHEMIVVAPGRSDGMIAAVGRSAILALASPAFPLDRRYRYFADEDALHRLLDRLAPDLVEASSPWSSAAFVSRWPSAAPRALFVHSDPVAAHAHRWLGAIASREAIDRACEPYWRRLRRLERGFDLVVAPSPFLARRLRRGGLERIVTLPMGVEPGLFSPALRSEALRTRLLARCSLGPEASLLVGIGRLSAEKRWPMVIEAVAAAGYRRPVGLVLVGDGADRARVVRAAANNPHIQLLAPIRDRGRLASLLASTDALVHGCDAETFCLAAAEAKASGLPLILPDRGGAADQFVPGQGALYRAGSAAALAEAIAGFLAEDPAAQRRRAAAASFVVHSLDAHFDQLFAAYRARLQRTARAA